MGKPKNEKLSTQLQHSSQHIFDKVLRDAISSANSPDKDLLLKLLADKDYSSLLGWVDGRPSPQEYETEALYFADCQVATLIKKYPYDADLVPELNAREAAIESFMASEVNCRAKNLEVRQRSLNGEWDDYAEIKRLIRDRILSCIGPRPELEKIYDRCDITAGASMGINGSKTNVARKLNAHDWTVTPRALSYAIPALWSNIQIRDHILPGEIVCYDKEAFGDLVRERAIVSNYNKISFVPKTAKTDRSIAVEPFLNGFVQSGTEKYLKDALLRSFGIDLSDQTVNQMLALTGSLGGPNPYCTIDLKAASDSMSIEVCRDLLPPDWFEFLMDIRASHFELPDRSVHRYEKMCSMGNGFCFPLQTLLYASVCSAAGSVCGDPEDFSVFGDDIVVRQNVALLVIEILQELGFTTNVEKTFIHGPFRESCGADWFLGQDVRPACIDSQMSDVRHLMSFHNSLLRSSRVEEFSSAMRKTLRSFGRNKYLRPGKEPGDSAFSVPLDVSMSCPTVRWDRNCQQWQWLEVFSKPVKDQLPPLLKVEYATTLAYAALRGANSAMPFSLRRITEPKERLVCRPFLDKHDKEFPPVLYQIALGRVPNVRVVREAVQAHLVREDLSANSSRFYERLRLRRRR